MNRFSVAKRFAIAAFVVAACRPAIGGSPTPSATSIAGDLAPSKEMTVQVHLPGAPDALASSMIAAIGRGVADAAGIRIETVSAYSIEEGFAVSEQIGITDIFLATPAAALVARESGYDVVMIAGLQRSAGLRLAAPSGKDAPIDALASGSILVQGRPGDEAPLLQYLDEAGVDPGAVAFSFQEPTLAFDPTGFYDSTFSSALVTSFDGAARLQEFLDPVTGVPLGPDASIVVAGTDDDTLAKAPGLGLWVLRSALDDEDSRIAIALAVIAIADGAAFCRDDAQTCAVILEESYVISDRRGVGLLWSINELNSTFWPAPGGALSIDVVRLQSAIEQAVATGVITGAPTVEQITDPQILELVESHLPENLDLTGENWVPLQVSLFEE